MINIFEPPLVYLMLIGMVFAVGIVAFKKLQPKDTVKRFKGQSLNEVIQSENIAPYVRQFGRVTKKGKLISQYKSVDIRRVALVRIKYKQVDTKGKTKNITTKEGSFYVFQSGKSKLVDIPLLKKLVAQSEYFVIDYDSDETFITKDVVKDTWILKPEVFLYQLAGVWLSSDYGREFVTEFVFKKIYENLKEEDMNYPKRMVWYNDVYASNMTKRDQEYELERQKWKDRISGEVASSGSGTGAS